MTDAPLAGRTIGITADRRWQEQADLLRRRGASILHGPTLRTVDLSHDEPLRQATASVVERPPDYLVITTGMGFRMWLEAAAGWGRLDGLKQAFAGARIVARGAKAASAVKGAGLSVWWQAPHETMEEIVEHLGDEPLAQSRVALQLFDPGGHPSTLALAGAARELVEVPVYRWHLPDDPEPAQRLVEATVTGHLDAVTFTSQPAVHHLFRLADGVGHAAELREALNGPVVPACIGPVCAEAAREEGIAEPIWPDPPRLPAMVRQLTERLGAASPA
ncbi:MAG: uroporphyrinogen-III synthase [Actinomycetota bacterium]|nr:uroporphyrinogen-III synthase [Actinomycetota bacterium]